MNGNFERVSLSIISIVICMGAIKVFDSYVLSILSLIVVLALLWLKYPKKRKVPLEGIPREICFENCFSFHPRNLDQPRYQKEALLVLCFFAKHLLDEGKSLSRYPDNHYSRDDYKNASSRYHSAFELLEEFNPQLTAKIPHWTELPKFVEKYLDGEPMDLDSMKDVSPENGDKRERLIPC